MFRKHVFVCTEGKTCPIQGSHDVLAALRQAITTSPHNHEATRINKSGCFSQCGNGPMVVVYPEGTWYCQVSAEDCKEIVEEHLGKNQTVARLLYGNSKQV